MNQQRAVANTCQLKDIETSSMAQESRNEYTPLDLSMKGKATSTGRDGTQDASSALGAYNTISDEALRYQTNTQHMPTTDEICNVDGMLLEPEEWRSKAPVVSEQVFNRLPRSRNTNVKHVDSACFCPETDASAPQAPKQPWLKKETTKTRLLRLPSATKQLREQARNSSRDLHALPTVALRLLTTSSKTCGTRSRASAIPRTLRAIHMSQKAESPVPHLWRPAAAAITHSPVQATLARRKHRPFRMTSLDIKLG
ncbi:uncharacterized protein [Dermacentor albipictus]|uniref:uncharacterized protein isoform X2 n=1 Tax=Dermacentor albipictus TaxID=60249 RepID=UPI0038FD29B2